MSEELSRAEQLKKELFAKPVNAAKACTEAQIKEADNFCEGYMSFLDAAKTEREAVEEAVALARANGFMEFHKGETYQPGEKVYCNNRGKALILAVIGRRDLSQGVHITAAHIDSPRLDLPLLRRHQKVPVDGHPPGPARRDREKGWRDRKGEGGRGRRRPQVRGDGPAAPSGRQPDEGHPGGGREGRKPERADRQPPL